MRAMPADQVLTAAASALARRQLKTARSLMDTALAAPPPDAPVGELLSMRGVIRVEQRDIAGACQDYHQAIQWYEARGEDANPRLAQVLGLLATEIVEADPAQARAYLQRAVAIYDTNAITVAGHQTWRESRIADVARLGMLAEQDADFSTARAYYDRALELCAAARLGRNNRMRVLVLERLVELPAQ